PYLSAPLIPQIENTMLLETMRGCPYVCAYCFYSKSRRRPEFKADHWVLDGVEWALARNVKEVYFLDPSLNSRPGLKPLLKQIALLNKEHRLSLISEIRADAVDDELADLLATAGFTWFEIGLQSTNPKALAQMRRFADLDRFLKGVQALKQRQITTAVDLIVGLPGDDWHGFQETIQFVVDHGLHDDIQVFPLSVLPGTEFRRCARSLGLVYEKDPPYTVIKTPTFSQTNILRSFDHAESRLDVSLYPMPDLDLAWRTGNETDIATAADMPVAVDNHRLFSKVCLRQGRTPVDLAATARRVTQPYQLLIPPATTDLEYVARALSIFTESNPHTPLEMVFFDPVQMPDVRRLLQAARIARPPYLDGDLRLLFAEAGNRTVLFTVASSKITAKFSGPMQRHVQWWQRPDLPTVVMLRGIEAQGFDGLLIDAPTSPDRLRQWQDEMAPLADDLVLISFARPALYKRWLQKTAPDDYCFQILP
ncbi:MAG: radical SAM protein, partial [Desulfatitalea sp.]